MKALKIIAGVIAVLIVLVLALTYTASTKMHVEREIDINAPKALIKDQIIYFDKMYDWSPWSKIDPDSDVEFEGEHGKVGSKFSWAGNEEVGKGNMEITSIEENEINVLLTFIEPWEGTAETYYLFEEKDDVVTVKWGFDSEMGRPENIITLFRDDEVKLERDYDKGLQNLKEVCEKLAEEEGDNFEIQMVNFEPQKFLSIRDRVAFSEMKMFFDEHMKGLFNEIDQNSALEPAGAGSAIYYEWNEADQNTDMAVAVPINAEGDFSSDNYTVTSLEGEAYFVDYIGDYSGLEKPHEALQNYFTQNNIEFTGVALEMYIKNSHNESNPEDYLTRIYYFK